MELKQSIKLFNCEKCNNKFEGMMFKDNYCSYCNEKLTTGSFVTKDNLTCDYCYYFETNMMNWPSGVCTKYGIQCGSHLYCDNISLWKDKE